MSNYKFNSIQKILVPTDGSDYSMRAAEYAISIAKTLSAQILVAFVVDEIVLEQIAKSTERERVEKELKEDGQRYVKYAVGLAEKEGVQASSLIANGRPFEQIVHMAKGLNTDLIVMGTYGRRGADRILLGSVAERVIEFAPCPVLVIK